MARALGGAQRHGDPAELAREAAGLGAPADVADRLARRDAGAFELAETLWPAVRLFDALSTQWVYAGMSGVPVGLSYPALAPTAAALGLELGPQIFEDVRVMERETLVMLAERR